MEPEPKQKPYESMNPVELNSELRLIYSFLPSKMDLKSIHEKFFGEMGRRTNSNMKEGLVKQLNSLIEYSQLTTTGKKFFVAHFLYIFYGGIEKEISGQDMSGEAELANALFNGNNSEGGGIFDVKKAQVLEKNIYKHALDSHLLLRLRIEDMVHKKLSSISDLKDKEVEKAIDEEEAAERLIRQTLNSEELTEEERQEEENITVLEKLLTAEREMRKAMRGWPLDYQINMGKNRKVYTFSQSTFGACFFFLA